MSVILIWLNIDFILLSLFNFSLSLYPPLDLCKSSFMWFMIKVTFGEHDRCDDKTRPETRFVLRAISQPFSFSNFDNDMALLRLNDRVPITDFIRPICLPTLKRMLNEPNSLQHICIHSGDNKNANRFNPMQIYIFDFI